MIRLSLAFLVFIGWLASARPDNDPANGKKLIPKYLESLIGKGKRLAPPGQL